MKFFKVLLVLFLNPICLLADNPGGNYACWSYGNNMFYTHYWKDETYPGWGATKYHYYDDYTGVIMGSYSNNPNCNEINPNNNIVWLQEGGSCFISIKGTITQGNLGRIDYNKFVPCNLPLDDYLPFLFFGIAYFGVIVLNSHSSRSVSL